MKVKRSRILYFFLGILVVIAGLASRKVPSHLPLLVSKYPGDALWALMVFIGIGFLFINISTKRLAVYTLLFSYFIETTQLYHAPWIDTIRHTIPGALILGSGFSFYDMICYTIGAFMGVVFEWFLFNKKKNF